MEIDHSLGDNATSQGCIETDKSALGNSKSSLDSICGSDESHSTGFECNICLDLVREPVVTLCGHLYCWPCIYTWLRFQDVSTQNPQLKQKQCPLCKAEVSETTLIPLFCRGNIPSLNNKNKHPHLSVAIPRRPLGPASGVTTPRSSWSTTASSPRAVLQSRDQSDVTHSGSYYSPLEDYFRSPMFNQFVRSRSIIYTVIAMFAELFLARIFGESIANLYSPYVNILDGNGNSRFGRRIVQADQSLNRIWFFLFCCIMFFLLLF